MAQKIVRKKQLLSETSHNAQRISLGAYLLAQREAQEKK